MANLFSVRAQKNPSNVFEPGHDLFYNHKSQRTAFKIDVVVCFPPMKTRQSNKLLKEMEPSSLINNDP